MFISISITVNRDKRQNLINYIEKKSDMELQNLNDEPPVKLVVFILKPIILSFLTFTVLFDSIIQVRRVKPPI